MRVDFVKVISDVVINDERSMFISGDLGFNAFEKIVAALGKRFLNTGVAEQNMIGVAAGIAMTGFTPWVYSIAPFATLRCLEQIRNDICFHKLPVKLVGNGGGFTYGVLGSSHHALEDLAVLKALPYMNLFFPCTGSQVASAVNTMKALKEPSYLRLSISGYASETKPISENAKTLTTVYKKGDSLTVVGVGHAAQIILTAMKENLLNDVDVDVFGISRFPFNLKEDKELVQSVLKTKKVLVVEEHYKPGSMAESLKADLPPVDIFEIITPYPLSEPRYGSHRYHLEQVQMTPKLISERIRKLSQ